MYKQFLCLALSCALLSVTAQTVKVIQVTQTDGSSSVARVDNIDSIYFSSDAATMYIVENGDKEQYATAAISTMTYTTLDTTAIPSITWNGTSVTIVNPLSAAGVSITANNGHVTINSTYSDEVEYALYGSSTDGSLKIYSDKKYQLTLHGLTLTNPSGPAINSQTGKKGTIKSQGGTTNTLTDGSSYASSTEDQKGCLFSEGQLIFKGAGILNVYGNYKHAIVSDDYIDVRNSTINVYSAPKDALHANDSILVSGGTLNLTYTDDGMDCEGPIFISGGSITMNSSGTGSKGIKSNSDITITSGTIAVTLTGSGSVSSTDTTITCGIKTDTNLSILGGTITLNSTGSKGTCGIKASGNLTIGTTNAGGPVLTVKTTGAALGTSSSSSWGGGGWWMPERRDAPPGGGGGGFGGGGNSSYYGDPKAVKAKGAIVMYDGEVSLSATGTGGEALESKSTITLAGGKLYAYSKQDDAINASGKITFSGAWVVAYSENNDAIDSNAGTTGAITISGGLVAGLTAAGSPEEGFDCDNNRYITLTGGCALSAGGSQGGGSNSLTGAGQAYKFYTSSWSMTSGRYYSLMDASGNVLFTIKAPVSLSSSLSLITAPSMSSGSTYYMKYSTSAPTNTTSSWDGVASMGGTVSSATNVFSFSATK